MTMEQDKKLTGAELIAIERQRQKEVEGYSVEDDLKNNLSDDLVWAAEAYLRSSIDTSDKKAADLWPWGKETFKPKDAVRDLARAGALIAAAIDVILAKSNMSHD